MSYVVKLEQFEGPLDLLLYLIQREEMDVYDIPIARITEQYLRHIEGMEHLDLNPAGDFLVMAATLLRIKARMLLPIQPPGEENEEDPRRELVQRLLEYKKFKEAARRLEEHEADRLRSFTRPLDEDLVDDARRLGDEETFEVSLSQLVKALQTVLGRFETVVTHEVDIEPVSLEETTAMLQARLRVQGRLSFAELFQDARTRLEAIVIFMSLLELIKGGALSVHQAENFSELWIFPRREEPGAAARLDSNTEAHSEPDSAVRAESHSELRVPAARIDSRPDTPSLRAPADAGDADDNDAVQEEEKA
jgi:segregation and condensation protein A